MNTSQTDPSVTRPLSGVALWKTKIGVVKTRAQPNTPFDLLAASVPLTDLYLMFNGKAKPATVKSWRRGRRQAPDWALDMLARRIRQDGEKLIALADQIAPHTKIISINQK